MIPMQQHLCNRLVTTLTRIRPSHNPTTPQLRHPFPRWHHQLLRVHDGHAYQAGGQAPPGAGADASCDGEGGERDKGAGCACMHACLHATPIHPTPVLHAPPILHATPHALNLPPSTRPHLCSSKSQTASCRERWRHSQRPGAGAPCCWRSARSQLSLLMRSWLHR